MDEAEIIQEAVLQEQQVDDIIAAVVGPEEEVISNEVFKEAGVGGDSSSVVVAMKHLSMTLLSWLPEALQDTILDVDDALLFTGIIALAIVSICVPYFLIEGYLSVRPLKKKVVELNKSLWKVRYEIY